MNYIKHLRWIAAVVAVLAIGCFLVGILSDTSSEMTSFTSIRGESIELYGKGIFRYDSRSVVVQGIAQDIVTLLLAIPLMVFGLSRFGTVKGRLLLTGIFGYFLYTYVSFVFLWMYNPLFLVYVMMMSLSIIGFILSLLSIDMTTLKEVVLPSYPGKLLGITQIVIGVLIALMWLGRIYPTWFGEVPIGLEHYTTLVIQGLDLGILVPLTIISGSLLLRKQLIGILLTAITMIKSLTLGIAVEAMVVAQYLEGLPLNPAEVVIFSAINGFLIFCVYRMMHTIQWQDIVKDA